MSLHFTSKRDVLVAIKKARRDDDFEELRERIRSTIDWSCEHHEQVKGDLLASTLRAIHFAYDGDGENELLLLLGERTEAVFSRDADIKWAIMLGRVLLSMADQYRYIDHSNWLARRWEGVPQEEQKAWAHGWPHPTGRRAVLPPKVAGALHTQMDHVCTLCDEAGST